MRKFFMLLATAALLALGFAAPASAHVHGITPLACLTTDNPNSGANRAFEVSPAFEGVTLIPSTKGNAPLMAGDAGANAAPCN